MAGTFNSIDRNRVAEVDIGTHRSTPHDAHVAPYQLEPSGTPPQPGPRDDVVRIGTSDDIQRADGERTRFGGAGINPPVNVKFAHRSALAESSGENLLAQGRRVFSARKGRTLHDENVRRAVAQIARIQVASRGP